MNTPLARRTALVALWLAAAILASCASSRVGDGALAQPTATGAAPAPAPPSQTPLGLAAGEQERASYTIEHALFGAVGELHVIVSRTSDHRLHAQGAGSGAVLGFGREAQTLVSEFDLTGALPLTWSVERHFDGKRITDTAQQRRPGLVQMQRKRSDRADEASTFGDPGPVFDPLGLLVHLRTQSLDRPFQLSVLQARNLWRVKVSPARPESLLTRSGRTPATLVELTAEPLTWSREKSKKRNTRKLRLWLSADERRTPLLLVSDSDLGEVHIVAQRVDRGPRAPAVARR